MSSCYLFVSESIKSQIIGRNNQNLYSESENSTFDLIQRPTIRETGMFLIVCRTVL